MRLLALLISFFAWFMGASPMLAAVERDWNDCKADDTARSIAGCTRIIQGRGETNKNLAIAYNTRGVAYRAKGDFDRAIADFTEAIRLDPKFEYSYLGRGQAYFQRGRIAESLADLDQAITLTPTEPNRWLWRELAARRSNVPSRLHDLTSHIDMTVWPSPVVRLFLGQMTPSAVQAAADDPDPKKRRYQLCDVNFFGGELALLQGRQEDAERQLRQAIIYCLEGSSERDVARSELQRLGLRL